MLKKFVSFTLAILLLHSGAITAWADERPEDAAKRIAKAKAEVAKLGTGNKAGVKVKLLSGVELKGLVVETKDDEFMLNDPKTGQTTTIQYQNVANVKKWKNGSGAGRKVAIGILAGALVAVGVIGAVSAFRGLGNVGKIDLKFPPCFPNCPSTP
ncbi:MAG: hypothetical protein ACREEM_05440 [Blastocatellia bacterium]